jgi:hypothetical protein
MRSRRISLLRLSRYINTEYCICVVLDSLEFAENSRIESFVGLVVVV